MQDLPFRLVLTSGLTWSLGFVAPTRVTLESQTDGDYCLELLRSDRRYSPPEKAVVRVFLSPAQGAYLLAQLRSSSQTPDTGPLPSTPLAQTDSPCSKGWTPPATHPSPPSPETLPCPRHCQQDSSGNSTTYLFRKTLLAYAAWVRSSGITARSAQSSDLLLEFHQLQRELATLTALLQQ